MRPFPVDVLQAADNAGAFPLTDPLAVILLTLAAALLPMFIGIGLVRILRDRPQRSGWLLGGVAGILFASFFDLLKETAGLSTGTLDSATDVANVLAFGIGLVGLLAVHRYGGRRAGETGALVLLYLWAILGVGLHSLGEGVVIGYDFSTGATTFSLAQGLSFGLHKLGEGVTIGFVAALGTQRARHFAVGGLAGGVPTTLGALLGLTVLSGVAATVVFAASTGATVYMLARLFMREQGRWEHTVLGVLVGFVYMYLAGVLHQFQ